MARPCRAKWIRARRSQLHEESDRGTYQYIDIVRHARRLVRCVCTGSKPSGRLRLARFKVHPGGSGRTAADWLPAPPANYLEQGQNRTHADALLVSTRALLVRPKKERALFGKAGENSTIWDSPSPKFIMGGSDEAKFDHPTQKPVELMRRPILNHTRTGELVYEPFLGSGPTLAAAELTERVCRGLELDPKYCDVIVQRWQVLSGKIATLEGRDKTFEQVRGQRLGRV